MAINMAQLAKELIAAIGGRDNVSSVVHCATRLRFTLKDNQKANVEQAKKIAGVITVVEQGGQFQVVIGNTVPDVYKEVVKVGGFETLKASDADEGPKGNLFSRLIDTIAGIFPPILGVMCGGGLIKGLLAICSAAGWLSPDMGTYIVLNAIGDAIFYFLPILLGFSAGRKFGGSPYLTAVVGAALVYPTLIELAGGFGGGEITFLRIPVTLMNYSSSVIPIVVAAYASCKLEKFLNKKLHSAIRNFVTPMICLITIVPLTLLLIGPACLYLSNLLASGYLALPGVIGGVIVGALWQVLVIFGMHWSFIPVMINNISTMGRDPLSSAAQVAAMSQTGAAFGMFLKMKNKETKGMTLSTVTAGVFGITEPIVYGVTLPRKKPFIMGVIGGACGGAVAGLMGGVHYAMGAFGILCLPTTIDPVNGIGAGFWGTLVGMAVAFVVAALLNFITYKDDTVTVEEATIASQESAALTQAKMVYSPMNGTVIPLTNAKDPVHAQETLGKGAIIVPSDGKVYAPFDGSVAMVYDTRHAIGLVSDEGIELLIHVGMDTVRLGGKYFTSHVKQNETVKTGQLLMEFDIQRLKEEGFELESPVIVTNTPDYESVQQVSGDTVSKNNELLAIE